MRKKKWIIHKASVKQGDKDCMILKRLARHKYKNNNTTVRFWTIGGGNEQQKQDTVFFYKWNEMSETYMNVSKNDVCNET